MKTITIYVFSIFFTLFLVFPINPVKVKLPYESQVYYVFATVKEKFNNDNNAENGSVITSPNLVGEEYTDTDPSNPEFPTYTKCPEDSLQTLSVIVGNKLYEIKDVGFVRFENQYAKGKSKTTDIKGLLLWTGWVFDASLDGNGDGAINEHDVPLDYDLLENSGNGNGAVDPIEFDNWASDQEFSGLALFYEDEWIFKNVDPVIKDQINSNDSSELLKI